MKIIEEKIINRMTGGEYYIRVCSEFDFEVSVYEISEYPKNKQIKK
jgi:hypothetical protein